MTRREFSTSLLILTMTVVAGCDGKPKPPEVYPVSGTVTLDGQPLAEGTISFKTVATGSLNTIPVKDGRFEGTAEAGERRVEISAYKIKTGNFDGMKGEVKESVISKRFNLDSKLTATVTPAGPNQFTFEVSAK